MLVPTTEEQRCAIELMGPSRDGAQVGRQVGGPSGHVAAGIIELAWVILERAAPMADAMRA